MSEFQYVLDALENCDIKYELQLHPAVYTIEEMDNLGINLRGEIAKNLFLRDAKGTRHFLVVLKKHKQADLKDLRQKLSSTALSFASEERLQTHMKLTKGAVTPLGILNNDTLSVEVVFDRDFINCERMGVHPNANTATVWIAFNDLIKVIKKHGNTVSIIDV